MKIRISRFFFVSTEILTPNLQKFPILHLATLRACNISSVCHASVVKGCVPLSASSSLIYHFWFLKHHHRQRCLTTTAVWRRSCRTHENCMHAEQIIIIFYLFFFYFLLSVFVIVFNCIIQNKSYCLHRLYFSMTNASNNASFTGGIKSSAWQSLKFGKYNSGEFGKYRSEEFGKYSSGEFGKYSSWEFGKYRLINIAKKSSVNEYTVNNASIVNDKWNNITIMIIWVAIVNNWTYILNIFHRCKSYYKSLSWLAVMCNKAIWNTIQDYIRTRNSNINLICFAHPGIPKWCSATYLGAVRCYQECRDVLLLCKVLPGVRRRTYVL